MRNVIVEVSGYKFTGVFPTMTSPGNYPLMYFDKFGDHYCAACATQVESDIKGAVVYFDGSSHYCCQCAVELKLAYSNPGNER